MLIVGVLNGWRASSRGKDTRTGILVERLTRGLERKLLRRKSMLLQSRARMYRRFILDNQDDENELLLVGKSLGARNLIAVANKISEPLAYRRTALVTIDPCFPLLMDWKPNLNRHILRVEHAFDWARNFYAVMPQNKQAGALIYGENAQNIPMVGVDHISITRSPVVEKGIREVITFLCRPPYSAEVL